MSYKKGEVTSSTLKTLTFRLENSLNDYRSLFEGKVSFGKYSPFAFTPSNTTTARTVIPVEYNKKHAGEICVLLFKPGEGTGANTTIPREKTGIIAEAFFPFFSVYNQFVLRNVVSLEEKGIEAGKEKTLGFLGLKPTDYSRYLFNYDETKPFVQLTVGKRDGKRFGDPHATVFNKSLIKENSYQLAGFLAINNESDPLLAILKEKAKFLSQI